MGLGLTRTIRISISKNRAAIVVKNNIPCGGKSSLLLLRLPWPFGVRCQVSAPPLGASTQFDRKRNFSRSSFIQVFRFQVWRFLTPDTWHLKDLRSHGLSIERHQRLPTALIYTSRWVYDISYRQDNTNDSDKKKGDSIESPEERVLEKGWQSYKAVSHIKGFVERLTILQGRSE